MTNISKTIVKGTWTEWQNRDGIYLLLAGSNSVYAGFATNDEAADFAKGLDGNWTIHRNGVYKNISDQEAASRHDVRRNRIRYGFHVEPIEE